MRTRIFGYHDTLEKYFRLPRRDSPSWIPPFRYFPPFFLGVCLADSSDRIITDFPHPSLFPPACASISATTCASPETFSRFLHRVYPRKRRWRFKSESRGEADGNICASKSDTKYRYEIYVLNISLLIKIRESCRDMKMQITIWRDEGYGMEE